MNIKIWLHAERMMQSYILIGKTCVIQSVKLATLQTGMDHVSIMNVASQTVSHVQQERGQFPILSSCAPLHVLFVHFVRHRDILEIHIE